MPAKKTTTATKTPPPKATPKTPMKKAVAPRKRPAVNAAPAKTSAPASATIVTPEQRFRMIEEQAYFIAERDSFCAHPDSYWFAAEREVASMLGE